jgi:hypothetical protein
MGWMQTGYEALEETKSDFAPDRFWVPTGQTREIVFVDAVPAVFKEHNARMNNSWKNWLTCASVMATDNELAPCCSIIGEPYQVAMYTIIDCSKWTDKKGNSRQYEIKVLPAKYKTAAKLKRKHADLVNNQDIPAEQRALSGKLFRVIRDTDKDPSVGNDFEKVRDVDVNKLFDLVTYRGKKLSDLILQASNDQRVYEMLHKTFGYTKDADGNIPRKLLPFNYESIYEPKSAKDIKLMLRNFKPEDRDEGSRFGGGSSGGSAGNGGGSADESVPF